MPTTTDPQADFDRLYEVCAGHPSESISGRFHQAARDPYNAEGWRRLAELAEEIAIAARRMEQLTR